MKRHLHSPALKLPHWHPHRESASARRRRLWREGTSLQNRNWFLAKCAKHGHACKGTVWDQFCPGGTALAPAK